MVADDEFACKGRIMRCPFLLDKLFDDPVTHFSVVSRYLNEDGLNADILILGCKVGQKIELLLDLVNRLFLVRDHF